MRIPGVVSIQLAPPLSVAEVQTEADDAEEREITFAATRPRFF